MLTPVFASYAFALLGGLLVFGALSDHLGRRPAPHFAPLADISRRGRPFRRIPAARQEVDSYSPFIRHPRESP